MSDFNNQNSYYINSQSDLKEIPYGTGDLSVYGCGPIALFNAIQALDEENSKTDDTSSDVSLSSVIDYIELKGAAFKGRLGTAPHIINRFLRQKGYFTRTFLGKSSDKLNKFSEGFEAFISLIYNDSRTLKKGLHFICTKKNAYGSFTTHNPERTSDTLYNALNLCSNDEIRHVYTIGIKKST